MTFFHLIFPSKRHFKTHILDGTFRTGNLEFGHVKFHFQLGCEILFSISKFETIASNSSEVAGAAAQVARDSLRIFSIPEIVNALRASSEHIVSVSTCFGCENCKVLRSSTAEVEQTLSPSVREDEAALKLKTPANAASESN